MFCVVQSFRMYVSLGGLSQLARPASLFANENNQLLAQSAVSEDVG